MVYSARPDTGDARVAWDRFTVLHETEPLEMELLDNEHKWRFRCLTATASASDVKLSVAGLEALATDPERTQDIKTTWEIVERTREKLKESYLFVYIWFGIACLFGLIAFAQAIQLHAGVMIIASIAMAWFIVVARRVAPWWRNRNGRACTQPDFTADFIFWILANCIIRLFEAFPAVNPTPRTPAP